MSPSTALAIYLVFAVGAVAIHALLPRRRPRRGFGILVGICAVAALVGVLAWRVVIPSATSAYFFLFSTLAIVSAARVVTHTKPVYSALYFILTIVAVACLLILLQAEFLAASTIIIYAGAILVTYLFVIMLAQQSGAPAYDLNAREPLGAVFAGFVLMAGIAGKACEVAPVSKPVSSLVAAESNPKEVAALPEGNTAAVGSQLMTRYVTATQLAAILLLISMVGAIALSKKRVHAERSGAESVPIGKIGREVEPF